MFKAETDISDEKITSETINELPAFRNTLDDSNNVNLLNIITNIFNQQKNSFIQINNLVQINQAQGKILDDLASDYGISRVDSDDEFLRFLLRWSIFKSKTATTINGLKKLVSNLLNIDIKTFDIKATENVEEIELINIPFNFASGDHANLKRKILANAIQEVLPVEYNLKDIQYSRNSQIYPKLFIASSRIKVKNYKEV